MDLQLEINQLTTQLHHRIAEKDKKTYKKIADQETVCYENSKDDMDAYVKCMKKLGKSIDYHEKMLNFKTEFVRRKAIECFHHKIEKDQDLESCKQEAKTQVEKFIQEFKGSV